MWIKEFEPVVARAHLDGRVPTVPVVARVTRAQLGPTVARLHHNLADVACVRALNDLDHVARLNPRLARGHGDEDARGGIECALLGKTSVRPNITVLDPKWLRMF